MNRNRSLATLAVAALVLACGSRAQAQAVATAKQAFQLSAFGGLSGVATGLYGGGNLSVTAGANLAFPGYFGFRPSVTLRGTYPVASGNVIGERNVLGGLQVERRYGRFHPYGDILFGRGQINYAPGYQLTYYTFDSQGNDILYTYTASSSNVISPGGGVDIDLTDHFAVKADVQYQHYNTPVTPITPSGHLWATSTTLGVVYRFDFNHHRHSRR
ncbi:porin family protein [Granulicella sp. WH15]|uniref:outer membrane beta-barrel protein n=1 Tax=Granulicella sp. WH15 TaxID=2602070 RepID=UPI001367005C|nr:outer membrane beta-barrel protein [Granulicella sp. WH15]QHN03515.1 porin family protein [Granulicella sp. WH15]